jgi:dinuclear metal center YbgI/SA1388 family protein
VIIQSNFISSRYGLNMTIASIINVLETIAPPSLQETYDNAGLLIGSATDGCTGVLVTLDVTEAVVDEAVAKGANLIVAHHPLIFSGLKRISPNNHVGATVIRAIRNGIAVYAIHTNLDNTLDGVNGVMAEKLGLVHTRVLVPKPGTLRKLYTFVPHAQLDQVREAIFAAGGGQIGNYEEAGFSVQGLGFFKAGPNANPFVGTSGQRHYEEETKLELIYPAHLEARIVAALKAAHPYEEVAYDLVDLRNQNEGIGSGAIGEWEVEKSPEEALELVKQRFGLKVIRHTPFSDKPVKRVALCGGAGSFLISNALRSGADLYITADVKYHEFFGAEGRMILADIGHFESEQFTSDLLFGRLREKFPNFAVLKSMVETNPIKYFI